MYFQVAPTAWAASKNVAPRVILVEDAWDDWFEFSTMYTAFLVEANDIRHQIGSVKIGQFNMKPKQRRPELPSEFETLDENFFSLGQDDSYYDNLNELIPDLREE